MSGFLTGSLVTAMLVLQAAATASAQDAKTPAKEASKELRLNGCISRDARTPGQFNFREDDSGDRYRLTGKNLKKFVGQRVEIVGGPPGKGITFKTGLWPSPNVAAQAGAMDPAQAAVARMPGGAADAPGASALPEFHVIRLRGVEGACQ
ncbi:MAG TPA: hypothetical protein VL693_03895 [Vicinamibacterales bacterium]|jgi:hypothetical protein|nr:hypothetical protein [Vicinamibacterales bacterium]